MEVGDSSAGFKRQLCFCASVLLNARTRRIEAATAIVLCLCDRSLSGPNNGAHIRMSNFDNRQKGFEGKFVHDQELQFKASARRNKLLGLWAAGPDGQNR